VKHSAVIAVILAWPALCLPGDSAPRPIPRAIAFSPDGQTLAAGSVAGNMGAVTLWDVSTRKPRWKMAQPEPVRALAWTADGKTLIAGMGSRAVILDPATGNQRAILGRHGKWIACLSLTADGRTVATGGDDGSIKVWDVPGKKEQRTIKAHRGWVSSICLSSDGKRLLSTGDEEAQLWDLSTGKSLHRLAHSGSLVRSAVFTPDGKRMVTAGWDGKARLWDAETADPLASFGSGGGLDGVLLQPTTHVMALWGLGKTIDLFDLDLRPPNAAMKQRIAGLIEQMDQDEYAKREAASKGVRALGWVAAAALEKAAKGSPSAEVRIRARTALKALQTEPRRTLRGHTGNIRAVCFSKDGKTLASGSEDGTVRLWNLQPEGEMTVLGR
jgi:WD40 repeat protein